MRSDGRFGYFSIQRAAMYQDKFIHLDAGTHTIIHTVIFMGNWRDRFEKRLTEKQEESYQCHFAIIQGHGYPRQYGNLEK